MLSIRCLIHGCIKPTKLILRQHLWQFAAFLLWLQFALLTNLLCNVSPVFIIKAVLSDERCREIEERLEAHSQVESELKDLKSNIKAVGKKNDELVASCRRHVTVMMLPIALTTVCVEFFCDHV